MLWIGLLISALTLLVGYFFRGSAELRAVMFTTLAFTQIAHALGLRALRGRGASPGRGSAMLWQY
jgi:hypothetical protein